MEAMKNYPVYILFLLLISLNLGAQTLVIPTAVLPDTVPVIRLNEENLGRINDIRKQFEKQQSSYKRPLPLSERLAGLLKKDTWEMSEEALYWIHLATDSSAMLDAGMTFEDTVIVNPLFLPLLTGKKVLPVRDRLYNLDSVLYPQTAYGRLYEKPQQAFADILRIRQIRDSAYAYVRYNYPTYFKYSEKDLPAEIIKPAEIKKDITKDLPIAVKTEATGFEDLEAPARFIPERLYWQSRFESAMQFSQNYISPNWHKGGNSNLSLFTKNYIGYDYRKDKVQFTNEFEVRVNVNTAPNDTLRLYKISDDVLRMHSNFGYQAYNKWYYTFDAEFKTQLFTNYKENTNDIQAALLSPFSINFGLGMKYDLSKQFADKYKNLRLSINLAPFSYTYMYSVNNHIDFGRHGFEKNPDTGEYKRKLSKLGSTIRTDITFNINRNVSWQSRLYYFTSYDHASCEFENTLNLAISRFFSTRINLHLRFDDSATKTEGFDSYYQINELLSFGFNYKW